MDLDRSNHYTLRRREVVKILLDQRDSGLLIVAGLGAPAWDVTAAGDEPLNFPLWGAMGGAVSIGLGLAIAQPTRRILVITGDGEMLMGLGSLATVSIQNPSNYFHSNVDGTFCVLEAALSCPRQALHSRCACLDAHMHFLVNGRLGTHGALARLRSGTFWSMAGWALTVS